MYADAWLECFNDDSHSLAATNACAAESVLATTTTQLVNQMRRDARARGSQRVRKRDCAAVYVRLVQVETEIPRDRGELRRERFVYFNQIHLIERESGLLQRFSARRCRADAHDIRFDTSNAP